MIELFIHHVSLTQFEKLKPGMTSHYMNDKATYIYWVGKIHIKDLELTLFTDDIIKEGGELKQ